MKPEIIYERIRRERNDKNEVGITLNDNKV
jgi:hypothetical protein